MTRPDPLNVAGWVLIAAVPVLALLALATLAAWATKETDDG